MATPEAIVETIDAPNCYLCESLGAPFYVGLQDRLFGARGRWNLLKCPRCGLVWLHPRPTSVGMKEIYNNYYTHEPQPRWNSAIGRIRSNLEQAILASRFGYPNTGRYRLSSIAGAFARLGGPLADFAGGSVLWLHASNRGRLLDVGSGSGDFLARMRALGWEVKGVEPDPLAAREAIERHGLSVTPSTLETAGLADDSFDVVTMSHVIEHVPDPIETLKECRRVLRPGGRLVVVTPNTEALGRLLFGRSWDGWHPPYHLMLFTPPLLEQCARRAGFQPRTLRTSSRSAHYTWYASKLLRQGNPPIWPRLQRHLGRPHIGGVLFWLLERAVGTIRDRGEEIVMLAEKGQSTSRPPNAISVPETTREE